MNEAEETRLDTETNQQMKNTQTLTESEADSKEEMERETSKESASKHEAETDVESETSKEAALKHETETDVESETSKETQAEDMADLLLADMSAEEKVYQLFCVTPEQLTGVDTAVAAQGTTKTCIQNYPVGGLIYMARNIISRDQIQTMIANTQSYSKIPVFTAVDEEGGKVARIASNKAMGTTSFPPMMTIGNSKDLEKAYQAGLTIGTDCMKLGFNLDFAPVADVASNPENTVIADRSFSRDPKMAADMVEACVKGFRDSGILCTLKHFPGHGDTVTDSHYEAASIKKSLSELKKCEFLPFEKGISAGAQFVMVGHILTPNASSDKVPATLSEEMISILRNDMKFDGVIITDAMNMAAITDFYSSGEAAIKAIKAGVDMLLIPENFKEAAGAVLNAVRENQISMERLDGSVRRILTAKIEAGIIR